MPKKRQFVRLWLDRMSDPDTPLTTKVVAAYIEYRTYGGQAREVSTKEVAQALGLSRSTAHRALADAVSAKLLHREKPCRPKGANIYRSVPREEQVSHQRDPTSDTSVPPEEQVSHQRDPASDTGVPPAGQECPTSGTPTVSPAGQGVSPAGQGVSPAGFSDPPVEHTKHAEQAGRADLDSPAGPASRDSVPNLGGSAPQPPRAGTPSPAPLVVTEKPETYEEWEKLRLSPQTARKAMEPCPLPSHPVTFMSDRNRPVGPFQPETWKAAVDKTKSHLERQGLRALKTHLSERADRGTVRNWDAILRRMIDDGDLDHLAASNIVLRAERNPVPLYSPESPDLIDNLLTEDE